jgi:hypothetical protein
MQKYKLHVYGWEMESLAHSITNEQVQHIQELMKNNGYNELWECRQDLESENIIDDIFNPDLFHDSKAIYNDSISFKVYDENEENLICEFDLENISDFYDVCGDDEFNDDYSVVPEFLEDVDNILFIVDESKGGIAQFIFESDEIPTPKDFCVFGGIIETPENEWDFVSRYFFKGQELVISDHLDNVGKSSTMRVYQKNGNIIL